MAELLAPEDLRERRARAVEEATIGPGEPSSDQLALETVVRHRDGHGMPVEISVTGFSESEGWVFNAFLRDITERRRVHEELEAAQHEVLHRLALAAEYRDDDSGEHTRRVGELAARLATSVGRPGAEVELIRRAAPLHDMGKIGIPDSILLKRGRLTETKPLNRLELHARLLAAERVTSLHSRLAEREAELADLTRRAEAEARLDALTGLGNRRRLDEDLAVLAARARRYDRSLAVALFDLDRFKAYNDRHGHLAGDEVLRDVARTLQASCRGGDVAYRYGGEELAVIMYEQSADGAVVALERMRCAIWEQAIPHPGNPPHGVVTVSGGGAVLGGGSVEELLQRADAALYAAKTAGRNRVVVDGPLQPV